MKTSKLAARMEGFSREIPCFEDITSVRASAMTGEGIEEIRSIIEEVASGTLPQALPPDANDEYEDYYDEYNDDDGLTEGGYLKPHSK